MPAPFGNRSPDLQPPGQELSRGFSRSASRPYGQVLGGAITILSLSRLKSVAEAAMAQARGLRFMRLGASRYPPVYVSMCISIAQTGASGAAAVELRCHVPIPTESTP